MFSPRSAYVKYVPGTVSFLVIIKILTSRVSASFATALGLRIFAMSTRVYLSLENDAQIFLYLDIIFGFSMALHCLSLYLLIMRTPQNQMVVRNYLIIIQVSCLLIYRISLF